MTIDDLRSGFADPPVSAAPMMRWWWFGPSVSRSELERELTAMAAAGVGGVEVAYVYPLAAATTGFGSDASSRTCVSLRSERTSSGSAST